MIVRIYRFNGRDLGNLAYLAPGKTVTLMNRRRIA